MVQMSIEGSEWCEASYAALSKHRLSFVVDGDCSSSPDAVPLLMSWV
jgi:hypothetical protein